MRNALLIVVFFTSWVSSATAQPFKLNFINNSVYSDSRKMNTYTLDVQNDFYNNQNFLFIDLFTPDIESANFSTRIYGEIKESLRIRNNHRVTYEYNFAGKNIFQKDFIHTFDIHRIGYQYDVPDSSRFSFIKKVRVLPYSFGDITSAQLGIVIFSSSGNYIVSGWGDLGYNYDTGSISFMTQIECGYQIIKRVYLKTEIEINNFDSLDNIAISGGIGLHL